MNGSVLEFAAGTAIGAVLVVVAAGVLRNRFFAIFAGVIMTVEGLGAVGLYPMFEEVWPVFVYLQVAVCMHFLSLARARMRPFAWRALVSVPGLFFAAGGFLGVPWAIAHALGHDPWAPWLPFAVAGFGVIQSLHTRETTVDLVLDGARAGDRVRRHRSPKPTGDARPLRIVQITDPHLGPLMSVRRLAKICRRAVEREPDLILLTGDFLTMESQADPQILIDALAPLADFEGPVLACFGNHDHEAPELVRHALSTHGIRLLVDDEAVVDTPAGPVQILGADFRYRERSEHLEALCAEFPRREGHLRLVMLHDPGAFKHLPEGEGDLVLSGHTHGGQLGLLSLGLPFTIVSVATSIPDHGLWARGRDRLYVHRATGVYGFPLRVGVPAEESLLRVYDAAASSAAV